MSARIEPLIFSREIVKPFSTGLNHPETHFLSFFDQIFPRVYMSIVYFYTSEERKSDLHRSDCLKKSLSAALSLYYPLAGRCNCDNLTVDCNDEGVPFIEARIACDLSDVLNQFALNGDAINSLFPDGLQYKECNLKVQNCPLLVQVTNFDCGGMAVAICFTHTMMDTSSICCFFNCWASIARNSGDGGVMTRPKFDFGTLYPANSLLNRFPDNPFQEVKYVQKRFIFEYEKINKLKAMVEKKVVQNPSRVEVVAALVFKCAVSAAARATSASGLIKPAALRLPVNLRSRVNPPFSEFAMGNFVGSIWVPFSEEEIKKLEWDQIAGKIRNEKNSYFDNCAKKTSGESLRSFVLEGSKYKEKFGRDQDVYYFSNWCGFPLYEADFGWGKPAWVDTARMAAVKDWIHMMDIKGGGIEVLVCLEEEDMAMFESDGKLLAFAALA